MTIIIMRLLNNTYINFGQKQVLAKILDAKG